MQKMIILLQAASLLSLIVLLVMTGTWWMFIPVIFTAVSIVLNAVILRMEKREE